MENLILVDSSYTSFYRFFCYIKMDEYGKNKEVWGKNTKGQTRIRLVRKTKIFKEKYSKNVFCNQLFNLVQE